MTTHSPLPWTRRMAPPDTWFIDDADGEAIILVGRNKTIHENHREIGVRITRDVLKPHADANAALFFAAPKLLEACIRAEMWVSTIPEGEVMRDVLRAAITEAETVIDGAEEAKAEDAHRRAELDRICGVTPPEAPVVP